MEQQSNTRLLIASPARNITYWITTAIIALETGTGAVWDIVKIPFVQTVMHQLGYPEYVLTIMGFWKALGVVALLAPRMPWLKEWTYAGLVFIYTGAAASHIAMGQTGAAIGPLIFTGLTFASWALRPTSRKMLITTATNKEASRIQVICYWTAIVILEFVLLSGGIANVLHIQSAIDGIHKLGYAEYFLSIIGSWKILGGVTLLTRRFPRLQEWAYAGIFFDLTGAAASYMFSSNEVAHIVWPLVFAGITVAAWFLRPYKLLQTSANR